MKTAGNHDKPETSVTEGQVKTQHYQKTITDKNRTKVHIPHRDNSDSDFKDYETLWRLFVDYHYHHKTNVICFDCLRNGIQREMSKLFFCLRL